MRDTLLYVVLYVVALRARCRFGLRFFGDLISGLVPPAPNFQRNVPTFVVNLDKPDKHMAALVA
ncbi:hypothetical protein, partial [Staphylococcus aureus]|uniref:hypothetical protein n=1 Tax=Staphylococcus aureus TaxID=1280 RepID=UPI001E2C6C1B